MANLRLGHKNYADLATLTSNPAVASGSVVSYLQNDNRGDLYLASVTSATEIKGTWNGTAYDDIQQFTLWRHNGFYSGATPATVRVVLYPNADWTGTPLYDSTAVAMFSTTFSPYFVNWGWAYTNLYFAAFAGCKSFKITVTVAVVSALQAMRVYLGPYVEAPVQIGEGAGLAPESNSTQMRSQSGSLRSLARAKFRTLTFDMLLQTEADRAAWFEIAMYVDVVKSFVACVDPGGASTLELHGTLFGKFERSPATKLAQGRYDLSMKILEI